MQPKAALIDPPASVRPFSANSQATSLPGYHPPPADKQKLVLCKYFEQGRDHNVHSTLYGQLNSQSYIKCLVSSVNRWAQWQHCQHFVGECQRGSGCWFAHGRDELRNPHKHASRQQVCLLLCLQTSLPVVQPKNIMSSLHYVASTGTHQC